MAKRSNKRVSQEEKRRKYLQWGMVFFMGAILTTSLFIFALQLSPTSQLNAPTYNDITFNVDQRQQLYVYRYDGIEHRTATLPQEVDTIVVPPELISDARETSRITIVRPSIEDQGLALATYLLSESLTNTNRHVVTQAYSDREPIASCADASGENLVLLFDPSNETVITYEDSCARIDYADPYSALLTKDAILYRILGVIE